MAGHVVKVSVVAETRNFTRAFNSLARETGLTRLADLGKQAAVTFAAVGAAALAAGAAAGAKAISLAGDLQQSAGAVQDIFKQGAGQMAAFAQQASTSVGVTRNEYNEMASILGAQLKNAGVPMDELAGKTNDLITRGADMAAMFGGTTSEAVEALSSALKGERDPIERYGVSLKQAQIDAKAAAMGFADTGSQQAQQAATLALIADQTADAAGKFGRESDTWSHQVQVIKARVGDFVTSLGEKLLPAATRVATWFAETGEPALERLADTIVARAGPAIAALADWFQSTALPALKAFGDWFQAEGIPRIQALGDYLTGTVIPTLIQLIGWITQHRDLLITIAGPILAMVAAWEGYSRTMAIVKAAQTAATAAQAALNAVMTANPIGIIVVLIAGLITFLVLLYEKNQTVHDAVNKAWNGIKSVIGSVAGWITGTAIPGIVGAFEWFTGLPGRFASWFGGARDRAVDAIGGMLSEARALPGRAASALASLPGALWNAAWSGFHRLIDAATSGGDGAVTLVSNLPMRLAGQLVGLGGLLFDAGASILRGFLNGLQSMWDSVTGFVGGIASWIRDHKGPISYDRTLLTPAGRAIMSGLVAGLASQMPALTGQLDQITATLAATTTDLQVPTITPATIAAGRTDDGRPIIVVQALDATADLGRRLAEALDAWHGKNGTGR